MSRPLGFYIDPIQKGVIGVLFTIGVLLSIGNSYLMLRHF